MTQLIEDRSWTAQSSAEMTARVANCPHVPCFNTLKKTLLSSHGIVKNENLVVVRN